MLKEAHRFAMEALHHCPLYRPGPAFRKVHLATRDPEHGSASHCRSLGLDSALSRHYIPSPEPETLRPCEFPEPAVASERYPSAVKDHAAETDLLWSGNGGLGTEGSCIEIVLCRNSLFEPSTQTQCPRTSSMLHGRMLACSNQLMENGTAVSSESGLLRFLGLAIMSRTGESESEGLPVSELSPLPRPKLGASQQTS